MNRTVLSALLVALLLAPAAASDWPRFLGPNGDVMSPETGINKTWNETPPKLVWKTAMHDRGYAGPSVREGVLYIIDHQDDEDVIRALDLTNGKERWTYRYKDLSRPNYGFSRSTPVIAGGGIYTLSAAGRLHCFALKNHRKVWSIHLPTDLDGRAPKWLYAMSPYIDGDRLIAVPGGRKGCVAALDRKTGKAIWQSGGSDRPGYATPVRATIDGVDQYVVFTGTRLIGVAVTNGKLLWERTWRTRYDVNAATPVIRGDEIFITSNYGRGGAVLKIANGRVTTVWENKTMASHFSTPIVHEGHIYGSTSTNKFVCMEWKTGATKWETRGFERGGVVGVDGTLIALDGRRGTVVMFELTPTACKELGRMKGLGGQSWIAPIIADGKLIIRNRTALACYALK
jgi:outer membrane protein assembly factor BamB